LYNPFDKKNPISRECRRRSSTEPCAAFPPENDQLVPERRSLGLKLRVRSERETNSVRTNRKSPIIRSAYAIHPSPQRDEFFGTESE